MMTMTIIMITMIIITVIVGFVLGKRDSREFHLGLAKASFKGGYATKKELEFLLKNSSNRDDKKNFLNREEQFEARKALRTK